MKIKLKKITAVLFALTLLLGILSACNFGKDTNGTTLDTMAPVDNVWRDALTTSADTTKPPLTKDEIDAKVREALGADSGWDGNYATLTAAQKEKIKAYFANLGYQVDITASGVVIKTDTYETPTPVSDKVLSDLTAGTVTALGNAGNAMFERVFATADGGFTATGFFSIASGDCSGAGKSWAGNKSMIVKYDKDSKVERNSFLGGDGGGVNFRSMTQLADKSYIAVGDTTSPELGAKSDRVLDAILVKYSPSGKQEWIKIVGGTKNEWFGSVAATPDGGFIAGGKVESSDGDFEGLAADMVKAVLIKYDASGEVRWKRALSGTKSNDFEGIAVNQSNGGVFATCKTYSNDGDFSGIAGRGGADTLVFSYDKNGNFNWAESFSGSGDDEMTVVASSPDGGCVIAGKFTILGTVDGSFAPYHNAGSYDSFIVKYNKNGTIGWTKSFAGFNSEEITGITPVNGGYAAVGLTDSNNRDFVAMGNKGGRDGFLLLISELGVTVKVLPLAGTAEDVPRSVSCYDGSKIIVVGGTNSSDLFFAGLSPAITKNLYNCFTATFTAQFKESDTTAAA